MDSNREIAIRLREHYAFYFVAVTFTILGFSIQTARFGASTVSSFAELSSWVALLISGILGLRRLQAAFGIYDVYADVANLEKERTEFEHLRQGGTEVVPQDGGGTLPIAELIRDLDATIASAESKAAEVNKNQASGHRMQQTLFVGGLVLLIVSRGYEPASGIFRRLLCRIY